MTAALVTSGVAVAVAAGGAWRSWRGAESGRRYDRRREALIDAQNAVLALRDALREYGDALRATTASGPTDIIGSFTMEVPPDLDHQYQAASGLLDVMRSRLDSRPVSEAIVRWESVAKARFIDLGDADAVDEQRVFDEVNELIGTALSSPDGAVDS